MKRLELTKKPRYKQDIENFSPPLSHCHNKISEHDSSVGLQVNISGARYSDEKDSIHNASSSYYDAGLVELVVNCVFLPMI